ncbi:MAG: hypothetical protein ACXWUX_05680 [Allosphingosinicella sp.]
MVQLDINEKRRLAS